MSTIIIFYKGANQHSVSAGPTDRVVLNPGQNVVSRDAWDKIVSVSEKIAKKDKKRSGVLHLMDENLIKVIGESENDEGINFGELNQKDAIEVVETEVSLDNLDTYYITESDVKNRQKVLDAIDKQIEKIKKADQLNGDSDKP